MDKEIQDPAWHKWANWFKQINWGIVVINILSLARKDLFNISMVFIMPDCQGSVDQPMGHS